MFFSCSSLKFLIFSSGELAIRFWLSLIKFLVLSCSHHVRVFLISQLSLFADANSDANFLIASDSDTFAHFKPFSRFTNDVHSFSFGFIEFHSITCTVVLNSDLRDLSLYFRYLLYAFMLTSFKSFSVCPSRVTPRNSNNVVYCDGLFWNIIGSLRNALRSCLLFEESHFTISHSSNVNTLHNSGLEDDVLSRRRWNSSREWFSGLTATHSHVVLIASWVIVKIWYPRRISYFYDSSKKLRLMVKMVRFWIWVVKHFEHSFV